MLEGFLVQRSSNFIEFSRTAKIFSDHHHSFSLISLCHLSNAG